LEEFAIAAVPFSLKLVERDETERGRIDAVAQTARFRRAVLEHMAEVTVPMSRPNFGSGHAMAEILLVNDIFSLDRPSETRPPQPLSNLSNEVNRGSPDTTSTYIPGCLLSQ